MSSDCGSDDIFFIGTIRTLRSDRSPVPIDHRTTFLSVSFIDWDLRWWRGTRWWRLKLSGKDAEKNGRGIETSWNWDRCSEDRLMMMRR
jgi:hypothetical protein